MAWPSLGPFQAWAWRLGTGLSLLRIFKTFRCLSTCGVFHSDAFFWRSRNQTMSKHRNPLFDKSIGIGVELIAIDIMHTIHLGVMGIFVRSWCGG